MPKERTDHLYMLSWVASCKPTSNAVPPARERERSGEVPRREASPQPPESLGALTEQPGTRHGKARRVGQMCRRRVADLIVACVATGLSDERGAKKLDAGAW